MKKILIMLYTILGLFGFGIKTVDVYSNTNSIKLASIKTEVITSYQQLPRSIEGKDVQVDVFKTGQRYKLVFDFLDVKYQLEVNELPHHATKVEGFEDENREPRYMKYLTQNNERYLFYDFQNAPSDAPILAEIDAEGAINGFRPFILWNIDTGKLKGTKRFLIHGTTHIKDNYASADLVFPVAIDDLLQITVNYQTIQTSAWIITSTKNHKVTRINGETSSYGTIFDLMTSDLFNGINYIERYVFNKDNQIEHIKDVSNEYNTTKAKREYMTKINEERNDNDLPSLQTSEIFDGANKVYRVALGLHNNFGQTKLKVKDINVSEVLYTFNGEYFHIHSSDITSLIAGGEAGKDAQDVLKDIKKIIDFVKNNWEVAVIAVVVIIIALALLPTILGGTVKTFSSVLINIIAMPFNLLKAIFKRRK